MHRQRVFWCDFYSSSLCFLIFSLLWLLAIHTSPPSTTSSCIPSIFESFTHEFQSQPIRKDIWCTATCVRRVEEWKGKKKERMRTLRGHETWAIGKVSFLLLYPQTDCCSCCFCSWSRSWCISTPQLEMIVMLPEKEWNGDQDLSWVPKDKSRNTTILSSD